MLELLDAARRSPAFAGFSEVQLQDLALMARVVEFPAGTELFHEGESADALYIVSSGIVRVSKGGRLLAALGPGGVLGEMALLTDAPRSATAAAEGTVRACRLGRDGFDELLESGDPVAVLLLRNLARLACDRLRALDERFAALGSSSPD